MRHMTDAEFTELQKRGDTAARKLARYIDYTPTEKSRLVVIAAFMFAALAFVSVAVVHWQTIVEMVS